jgi:hypothetical protein
MARTTALVIIILAVVAALVTGIQIGRRVDGGGLLAESPIPTTQPLAFTSPSPINQTQSLNHQDCGVQFEYPSSYKMTESSNSAILINSATTDRITLACSTEIPIPPLPPEKIEEATVAGQIATIYHDASAQNGSPVDVVILSHPVNGLTVAMLGFGEIFEQIVASVRLSVDSSPF